MRTARLFVSPVEYVELSDFKCFGDGIGYSATLKLCAGEFACLGREFYFDDLRNFIAQFQVAYARVRGSVELRSRYEEEFLRFAFTRLGRLDVSGLLVQYGPHQCRLAFSFEADQSFCPPFIDDLKVICRELHL